MNLDEIKSIKKGNIYQRYDFDIYDRIDNETPVKVFDLQFLYYKVSKLYMESNGQQFIRLKLYDPKTKRLIKHQRGYTIEKLESISTMQQLYFELNDTSSMVTHLLDFFYDPSRSLYITNEVYQLLPPHPAKEILATIFPEKFV